MNKRFLEPTRHKLLLFAGIALFSYFLFTKYSMHIFPCFQVEFTSHYSEIENSYDVIPIGYQTEEMCKFQDLDFFNSKNDLKKYIPKISAYLILISALLYIPYLLACFFCRSPKKESENETQTTKEL